MISPKPWELVIVEHDEPTCECCTKPADTIEILDSADRSVIFAYRNDIKEEDAKHIVKCVNMHDELVEAVEKTLDDIFDYIMNDVPPEFAKGFFEKRCKEELDLLKRAKNF